MTKTLAIHTLRVSAPTLLATLLVLALAGSAWGADWQMGQTADSMDVTMIADANPDSNYGAWSVTQFDNQGANNYKHALYRPTFADTTAGYTQDSCKLHFFFAAYWEGFASADDTARVEAYLLRRVFGEGTGTGADGDPAQAGEASWNAAQEGTQDWTTPGATSGQTDIDSTLMDTVRMEYGIADSAEFVLTIIGDANVRKVIEFGLFLDMVTVDGFQGQVGIYSDDDGTDYVRPYFEFWESAPFEAVTAYGGVSFGAKTTGGGP